MELNKAIENLTGYASIDKPWLVNYDKEDIDKKIPQMTLYDFLYSRNYKHKAKAALVYEGKKITFDEMFMKIEEAAKAFKSIGIKNNEVVTMCPVNTPEFVYSFYALNKIGAIVNMVLPTANKNEIIKYMKESDSHKAIILDAKCEEMAKAVRQKDEIDIDLVISVSLTNSMSIGEILKNASNKNVRKLSKENKGNYIKNTKDLTEFIDWKTFIKKGKKYTGKTYEPYEKNKTAVIVRSGGTTGKPKPIELTNDNYNAMVIEHDKAKKLNLSSDMTCLQTINMYAPFGSCNNMHLPLCKGISLPMQIIYSPEQFIKYFLKYRPNITFTTPEFLIQLKNYIIELEKQTGKKYDLSYWIYAIVGGESPSVDNSKELNAFFKERGKKSGIEVGYGFSEGASAITCTALGDSDPNKAGIPYADNIIKVVDPETKKELPYNEPGLLYVSGPTIMKGYLNNPEETNKVLAKDEKGITWYCSGDICTIDENGNLKPISRQSRIAKKFDGCNVPITEVENVIESHPMIESCAIVAIKDPVHNSGEVLVAHVVLKPEYKNKNIDIKNDLIDFVNRNINERYGIYDVVVRDKIPLTNMGKKNFNALTIEQKINSNPNVEKCEIKDENNKTDIDLTIKLKNDNLLERQQISAYIQSMQDDIPKNNRSIISFDFIDDEENSKNKDSSFVKKCKI